jgi:hypothetical protein
MRTCDNCGSLETEFFTLPKETHSLLKHEHEFHICCTCADGHSITYWKQWITNRRNKNVN